MNYLQNKKVLVHANSFDSKKIDFSKKKLKLFIYREIIILLIFVNIYLPIFLVICKRYFLDTNFVHTINFFH